MGLKESGLRGSLRSVSAGVVAIPDSDIAQFESGSLHPSFEGDTSEFSVDDNPPVLSGTFSAKHTAAEPDKFVHSQSGLDNYPQLDTRFALYVRGDSGIVDIGFLNGGSVGDFYSVGLSITNDELLLNRWDSGSPTEITSRVSLPTISTNTWYDLEAEVLANGTITGRAFEVDQSTGERQGSELGSISGSDTNHTGEGLALTQRGSDADYTYDDYRLLEDLS